MSTSDYLNKPMCEFLSDLARKSATPGGGSVAAHVGSLAVGLARMCVGYTVGKPRFAEHEQRLAELDAQLTRAGEMFHQLMAEDMAAYERVSAARRSADEREKQQALAGAIAVPMEMLATAGAMATVMDELKQITNPMLLSDLYVGAILAEACARSAAINVEVNLVEAIQADDSKAVRQQLDKMLSHTARHCQSVLQYRLA